MKKLLCAALLLPLFAPQLSAQADSAHEQIKTKCKRYLLTPLPAEANGVPAAGDFPKCHSLWLYYGFGGEREDAAAARQCAWQERAVFLREKRYQGGPGDDGLETLANLYANGVGTERSLPLALRFACESSILGDGSTAHVEQLEALANTSKPKSKSEYFNMCEGEPGTPELAICARWDQVVKGERRAIAIGELAARMAPEQRAALKTLVDAEGAYAEAHAAGEIDISGSGRSVWRAEAQEKIQNNFLQALQSFEKGQLPSGTEADLAKANSDLDVGLHQAVADADPAKVEMSTVRPEGIQTTQQAWIKYRDAFVAFAKLRYPKTAATAWLALLTHDRADVLKDTLCEIGSSSEPCDDEDNEQGPSPLP